MIVDNEWRVLEVTVTMRVHRAFEKQQLVTFSYSPGDDDPLVREAWRKNHEITEAELDKTNPKRLA